MQINPTPSQWSNFLQRASAALIFGLIVLALQPSALDDTYRPAVGSWPPGTQTLPLMRAQQAPEVPQAYRAEDMTSARSVSDTPQAWASAFRPLEEIAPSTPVLDPSATQATLAAQVALAQSGNSTAALSIQQLESSCASPSLAARHEDCDDAQSLTRLASASQPFYWLLLAARLDDPRAGPALLEAIQTSLGSAAGTAQLTPLTTAALRSLEQSAMRGSLESLELLAQVYHDGTLVSPNIALEYAYTDAHAKAARDPVSADRARLLQSSLSAADRVTAQNLQVRLLNSAGAAH